MWLLTNGRIVTPVTTALVPVLGLFHLLLLSRGLIPTGGVLYKVQETAGNPCCFFMCLSLVFVLGSTVCLQNSGHLELQNDVGDSKSVCRRDIYVPVFIVALFTVRMLEC
jgi:hypothetical protein